MVCGIDMSSHSDTFVSFRSIQSLLILLNAVSLAEKQEHANFTVFGLTRLGMEPTIYHTLDKHASLYTICGEEGKWKKLIANTNSVFYYDTCAHYPFKIVNFIFVLLSIDIRTGLHKNSFIHKSQLILSVN